MLIANASLYYDQIAVSSTSQTDIEAQTQADILELARQRGVDIVAIDPQRLLLNWKLLAQSAGQFSLTVASVLFLGRSPQQWLPTAYITALRIPGADISVAPSDQKRIEGRLLAIIEDTKRFLEIHLLRPHHIQELAPEVTQNYQPLNEQAAVCAFCGA